jgi:hypothetical protein
MLKLPDRCNDRAVKIEKTLWLAMRTPCPKSYSTGILRLTASR